ncbi:MAG: DNA-3-methyladenine glycosylase, partial [Candidatus Aenigmatarchaeota archaeon]
LLNIVAHQKNKAGAVLIRAIEPIKNINFETNGPGKLTKALKIDKSLNGIKVYKKGLLYIAKSKEEKFEIESSKRIGVKRDLEENLRFYIKDNKFVSRRQFSKKQN